MLLDTHRTRTRPSASVRRGKGLVEVQLHHVNPDLSHLYYTHDGIHICTVTIDLPAFAVDDFGYFLDVFFKKTECVGVRYHNAGCVFIHNFCDGFHGKDSLFIRCHGHRTVTAQRCAGRICAVCSIRDNDL